MVSYGFDETTGAKASTIGFAEEQSITSKCKGSGSVLSGDMVVRRLTPLECERLQGFPDGWTDIEYKGKPAPDTQRYKALGNSWAVPCAKWVFERLSEVDGMEVGNG